MKRFILFALASFLFAACGSDSESSSSEELAATGESDSFSQADSIRTIRQEGGEPGIPGSDVPDQIWRMDDGACYAYGNRVVRIVQNGANEAVSVFTGSDRGRCNASTSDATYSTGTAGDPATFFGVAGDLLLLELTNGDEHSVRVVDLASGAAVHDAAYEDPVEISEGGLFYGEPAAEFESQEELNSVGVNCPESRAWFEDSLAIGVSIRSRFDLTTREAEQTDDFTCIPLL